MRSSWWIGQTRQSTASSVEHSYSGLHFARSWWLPISFPPILSNHRSYLIRYAIYLFGYTLLSVNGSPEQTIAEIHANL